MEKGKQRVEDEGEGAGPSKRSRVVPTSEWKAMGWTSLSVGDTMERMVVRA